MRRALLLSLVACAIAARDGAAVTIDFEQFDLGASSNIDLGPTIHLANVGDSGVDVTIVGGQPHLQIWNLTPSHPSLGQALLDYVQPSFAVISTTILFSQPVADFSLLAGDLGADADTPLRITAYDADDNVLGADSEAWLTDQGPPFATLSVGASGIRKIVYSSAGEFPNSTFLDDLKFTPVPEPTAWALVALAAIGLGVRRVRRR